MTLELVTDLKNVFPPSVILTKPENATSPYIPTGYFMVEKKEPKIEGASPNFEIVPVREQCVVFLSEESAYDFIRRRIYEFLFMTVPQATRQDAIVSVKRTTRRGLANYEIDLGTRKSVFYVGIVAVDAPFSVQVYEGFYYVHEHPSAANFFCEFSE